MLRSILFPYSNYFIERKLNSQINRKFAKDFSKLIMTLVKILKIMADLEPLESLSDDKETQKKQLKKEIKSEKLSEKLSSENSAPDH